MSADFWSGYASGAVGIIVGNPLDVLKVQQQAAGSNRHGGIPVGSFTRVLAGTAAPIAGYGALNATLFVVYNRTEAALGGTWYMQGHGLWNTWLAGAAGGLSIWAFSTPTELVKCRAQMSASSEPSWHIVRQLWRHNGLKGLYLGGVVTALRDSVGYGFYFWAYEALNRSWTTQSLYRANVDSILNEALRITCCGGLAGIVTWASVYPLDVVKTRVQIQPLTWGRTHPTRETLLCEPAKPYQAGETKAVKKALEQQGSRLTAVDAAKMAFKQQGARVFFAGLTVCSLRAFVVNAVQWGVYEWMMHIMGQGRKQRLQARTEK